MPISPHYKKLRSFVGNDLLLYPAVAAIIKDEERRVLLQYKGDGENWSLPSGVIEPDESPAEALVREVKEETGLDVVPDKLIGVFGGKKYHYIYPNGDNAQATIVVFSCKVTGGKLEPLDPETKDLQYFAKDNLPEMVLPYPEELLFGENVNYFE